MWKERKSERVCERKMPLEAEVGPVGASALGARGVEPLLVHELLLVMGEDPAARRKKVRVSTKKRSREQCQAHLKAVRIVDSCTPATMAMSFVGLATPHSIVAKRMQAAAMVMGLLPARMPSSPARVPT